VRHCAACGPWQNQDGRTPRRRRRGVIELGTTPWLPESDSYVTGAAYARRVLTAWIGMPQGAEWLVLGLLYLVPLAVFIALALLFIRLLRR
jgi:predicted Abi (CAAX) family protease